MGGFQVTINGINLGSGSDITNVTLAGVAATNIASQSSTQVVVWAGSSGGAAQGDVVVYSASYGTTVRSNAFEYTMQIGPPVIGGFVYSNMTANSIYAGCTITSTNGVPVTERGIYVGTNTHPELDGVRFYEIGAFGNGDFTLYVTGLVSGILNYYLPYAVNSQGTNFTESLSGLTAYCSPPVLELPSEITQTNLTLNWADTRGATGYRVDVATDSGFSSYVNGYQNRTVSALSVSVTGLTDSTPYYYRVRAVNFPGASANSTTGMATTAAYTGGALAIMPSSLAYSGTYGGSDPAAQSLVITNFGEAGCTVTNTGSSGWFSVAPSGASLANNASLTITGRVSLTGLNAGTYITTNTLSGGTNGAQSLTVTLTVAKATSAISFSNTNQVYDGSSKTVTVHSVPSVSSVVVTYNGSPTAPTTPGAYAVTGTVVDANYTGSGTTTLTIDKASQTITFNNPGAQYVTNNLGLAATASSGLSVTFSVVSGPANLNSGTNLTFSGAGTVSVSASQIGNSTYYPAPTVTQTFSVTEAIFTLLGTNGAVIESTADFQSAAGTLFPDTLVGRSFTNTFAITNSGDAAWHLLSVVTNGAGAGSFAVNPITTVDAGSISNVTIVFAPEASGLQTAAVVFVDNTLGGSFELFIGGTGRNPNLTVLGTNGAVIESGSADGSSAGTAYGEHFAGNPFTHAFTLTNAGSDQLSITDWTTNGTGAAQFTLSLPPAELAAGEAYALDITYTPDGIGVDTASVVIINSSTNSPFILNLSGSSVDPRIALVGINGITYSSDQSANYLIGTDFGALATNESSSVTLALTNAGQSTLSISGYELSGTGFSVSNLPTAIEPGGSSNFVLHCAPSALGAESAVLTITNNSAVSPFIVNAAVTGVKPGEIGINRASVGYVTSYGVNPAVEGYVFTNKGRANLVYTNSVTYGAGADGWLELSSTGGVLSGNSSLSISGQVTSAGIAAIGTYYATNTITSPTAINAPVEMVFEVRVDQASQSIDFPNIAAQTTTNRVGLIATASSGLAVSYSLSQHSPATITDNTNLTFTGDGTVVIYADQAGNQNYSAAPRATNSFSVTKAVAQVSLSNLSPTYDGTAHTATVVCVPSAAYAVTYDGASVGPVNAGAYEVITTVNDTIYQGGTTGTLTIGQASQSISDFTPTNSSVFFTTNLVGLAGTASSGLPVSFVTNVGPVTLLGGTNLSFTGAGTVEVLAVQTGNVNYLAAPLVTNTYTITKAMATLTLTNLTQTFDGSEKRPTGQTDPSGLTVDFTYNGLTNAPVYAGSYAVTGTVNDAMYQGTGTGLFTIAKAAQTITNFTPADGSAFLTTNAVQLAASASSGLAVHFATNGGPASLSDSTLTFAGAGTVSVIADQAGSLNYLAAPHSDQPLHHYKSHRHADADQPESHL